MLIICLVADCVHTDELNQSYFFSTAVQHTKASSCIIKNDMKAHEERAVTWLGDQARGGGGLQEERLAGELVSVVGVAAAGIVVT